MIHNAILFINSNRNVPIAWGDPTALGFLIDDDFTALSSLVDYTNSGSGSFTLTGGYLRSSIAAGSLDYLRNIDYGYCNLKQWEIEAVFIPQSKAANTGISIGIGLGVAGALAHRLFFNTNTTDTSRLQIFRRNLQIAVTGSSFTFTIGDRIKVRFVKSDLTYTAYVSNLTTGSAEISCTHTTLSSSTTNATNVPGQFHLATNGGDQDWEYLDVDSTEQKNVDYGFIGDSITYTYSASTFNGAWQRALMANFPTKTYTNIASPSAVTTSIGLPEALLVHAKTYVMMIGGNDVLNGVAQATIETEYKNIRNTLAAQGSRIIHCKATPRDSLDMTDLNDFIETMTALYGDTVIDTFTPLATGTALAAAYDSGDGVHPNQAGHTLVADTVLPFIS